MADTILGIERKALEVSPKARDLQVRLNGLLDENRRDSAESDRDVYTRLALAKDDDLAAIERERDRRLPEIMQQMNKGIAMSETATAADQLAALDKLGTEVAKGALDKRAIVDAIIEKRIVELQAEKGVQSRSAAWAYAATDPVVQKAYDLSNQLGEEAAAQLRAAGL